MRTFEEQIVETNNYRRVMNCCADAMAHHKLVSIIGGPGYGKTTALLDFQKKYPNNVAYIRVTKSMSPKIFFHAVLNILEETAYRSTIDLHCMIGLAEQKFRENGQNNLLIIDEASKLSANMFEHLHGFRDGTAKHTGIILAGVEYFKTNMEKWVEKSIIGMPEIHSRISSWQSLKKPTKIEKRSIIESYNVNDEDSIKYMLDSNNYRILLNRIKDYKTVIENTERKKSA